MVTRDFSITVLDKHSRGFIFKNYYVLVRIENEPKPFEMLVNKQDFYTRFWPGMKAKMPFIQLTNGNWIPTHYRSYYS